MSVELFPHTKYTGMKDDGNVVVTGVEDISGDDQDINTEYRIQKLVETNTVIYFKLFWFVLVIVTMK